MPVYELFCLARPALAPAARADLLKAAGAAVAAAGGFLLDYKAFGDRRLAYPVRGAAGDKHEEVRGDGERGKGGGERERERARRASRRRRLRPPASAAAAAARPD